MIHRMIVLGATALILLSGCSTKVGNLADYQSAPLAQSKFMPTNLDAGKPKVVVFELSNGKNSSAIQADVGATAATEIERYINESGSVELVDRAAADKLQNEIQLIEMGGTTPYNGPAIANYAISGSISNTGTDTKFVEAVAYKGKDGKIYRTSPSCSYISKVSGLVKIYELPSMRIAFSQNFSDTKSQSEDARGAYDCDRSDRPELVRAATVDGIEAMRHDLKNFFATKGYISEKRLSSDGKKIIFKVEFGSNDGIQEGDEVSIYTLQENFNAIRKTSTQEEIKLGVAKVSEQITQNACWLLIEDKALADKIRLGDYVKVHYSKTFLDHVKGVGNTLNSI